VCDAGDARSDFDATADTVDNDDCSTRLADVCTCGRDDDARADDGADAAGLQRGDD
jgi:hypothetical protein